MGDDGIGVAPTPLSLCAQHVLAAGSRSRQNDEHRTISHQPDCQPCAHMADNLRTGTSHLYLASMQMRCNPCMYTFTDVYRIKSGHCDTKER